MTLGHNTWYFKQSLDFLVRHSITQTWYQNRLKISSELFGATLRYIQFTDNAHEKQEVDLFNGKPEPFHAQGTEGLPQWRGVTDVDGDDLLINGLDYVIILLSDH